MSTAHWDLPDEGATDAFAAALARALPRHFLAVALEGGLGAGKTRLVRGLLRALGVDGIVPSPTYTLMETYELDGHQVCHMDLYRLGDPEELEFLGLRDWLGQAVSLFVEWPRRGSGHLPDFDLWLEIRLQGEQGRRLSLEALTPAGQQVLAALSPGHV